MKVFGSEICGECRMFKALMAERGFEVEYIEITESVPNMREFLKMRDHEPAFDAVREKGSIGIPAFVNDDGEITLEMNTALGWIGQAPAEAAAPACASCR